MVDGAVVLVAVLVTVVLVVVVLLVGGVDGTRTRCAAGHEV